MDKKVFRGVRPDGQITAGFAISPDFNELSCLFDNLAIDLEAGTDLVATATYSFHAATELDDTRPNLKIDVRYFVAKTAWTQGKLVLACADSLKSIDLLFGSTMEGDQLLSFECPGHRESVGTPFQITVFLLGQRSAKDQYIKIGVDSMDITLAE